MMDSCIFFCVFILYLHLSGTRFRQSAIWLGCFGVFWDGGSLKGSTGQAHIYQYFIPAKDTTRGWPPGNAVENGPRQMFDLRMRIFTVPFWSCFLLRIESSAATPAKFVHISARCKRYTGQTHTHTPDLGAAIWGEAFGFGWLFCILFFYFLAIFYPSVFISICHVIRFIFFGPCWKSSLVICICNLLAVCFFFLCSVFCCIFQTSSFISDKLQTSDHDPVPVICHDDVDDDADGPADDLH